MTKLGPSLYFFALEGMPMHRRRIDAERAAVYQRPDAEPILEGAEDGGRRGIRLPSFLVRRRSVLARD